MMRPRSRRTGASLVEVIIAVTLFGFLGAGVVTMVGATYANQILASALVSARAYALEAVGAVESIREQGFNQLILTRSGVEFSGGRWRFRGEGSSDTSGPYARQVALAGVARDVGGTIVPLGTPGSVVDTRTKAVTVRVSWTIGVIPYELALTRYATDWRSRAWTQSDWLGGPGQTEWSAPDRYAADDGNVDIATAGEVKLRALVSGPLDHVWPFDVPGEYTYDPAKIEVTAGVARLRGTVTPVAGSSSNPGFSTGIAGWSFNRWGPNVGQDGRWRNGGGNRGGYAQIRMPNLRNRVAGGFFEQPFTVSATALTTAAVSASWLVERSTRRPDSLQVLLFVDPTPGAPVLGTQVWSSGNIAGQTVWAATGAIDVRARLPAPVTYYLKLAVWVDYPNNQNGQYWVGFDNSQISWSGTTTSYPSDRPSVATNLSFTPTNLQTWQSFSEVAAKAGGEIYYQLSADAGAVWQWYNGSAWAPAGSADYNPATVVNTRIGAFPTTTQDLQVRAFLAGDGTQAVSLDKGRVTVTAGAADFVSGGSLESSAFRAGAGEPSWHRLGWQADTAACPTTCAVQLQVAAAPDAGGSPGPFGAWVGAAGAGGYFTVSDALIPASLNGNQWLKYRLELAGDGSATPVVREVGVDYRP